MPNPSIVNSIRFFLVGLCLISLPSCGPGLPVIVSSTPTQVSIEFEPKKGVRSTSALAQEACAAEGRRSQYVSTENNVVRYDCVKLTLPAIVSATHERVAVEFDHTVGVQSTRTLAEAACQDVGKPAQLKSVEGSIAFYDCLEISVPERPVPSSSSTRGTNDGNKVLLAWRPYSGKYGGLQTDIGLVQGRDSQITWQPTRELDLYPVESLKGNCWSIAMNDNLIAAAAYVVSPSNKTQGPVHYRFGKMGKTDQEQWAINWGPSMTGISDDRRGVAIAINKNNVVVEISETGKDLYYRVGDIKEKKLESVRKSSDRDVYYSITWRTSSPIKYDDGKYPSVALMDDGTVVEVHYTSGAGTKLWSNVGVIINETIEWNTSGSGRNYTKGKTPSIAIRSDGTLIEVHKGSNGEEIWFKLGSVDPVKKQINWKGSDIKLIAKLARHPSVAVKKNGLVMISYINNPLSSSARNIYYQIGQANSAWSGINWGPIFETHRRPFLETKGEPTVPRITFAPTN